MFIRFKTQILSIEIIPPTISLGVVLFILTGLLASCKKYIPYLKGEHNGEKCVDKFQAHFDEATKIDKWSVNLDSNSKTIKVEGEDISERLVSESLEKEGYKVENPNKGKTGFWADIKKWKRATFNTLNCLIGCSIGDFGMIIFLQAYYPETPIM